MKAILTIGDSKETKIRLAKPFVSFVSHIKREARRKKHIELKILSYRDVLSGKLPSFASPIITVILFFPFNHWNKHIEIYEKVDYIYGGQRFGRMYKEFLERIEEKIKKAYKGKIIYYFNPPKASLLERDKKKTKAVLQRKGISVPKACFIKKTADIKKIIDSGKSLYVKPRFGSLGKGITYIDKDNFITNFIFKKGRIINRKSDYGWKFKKLKEENRNIFLKHLISKDFLFEEGIAHPERKGKIFDFRVHVVKGKTPYYYAKTVTSKLPITNWTQGGKIESKNNLFKYISKKGIKKVRSLAVETASALNLNYAAVDVVISKDFKNAYCLEAHSFPGYEKRFDVMKYIAKKLVK